MSVGASSSMRPRFLRMLDAPQLTTAACLRSTQVKVNREIGSSSGMPIKIDQLQRQVVRQTRP